MKGTAWRPEQSIYGKNVRGTNDHVGVDIYAKKGTPVKAAIAGKIIVARDTDNGKNFGKTIWIKGKIDGKTVYVQYGHLDSLDVKYGNTVEEGVIIGKTGQTGNASDQTKNEAHLHFGVTRTHSPKRKVADDWENPADYFTIAAANKENQGYKDPEEKNKKKNEKSTPK